MTRPHHLLPLLLPLLISACGGQPEAPPPARAVRVAVVESGAAQAPVIASGVLAARDEAKLAFKIGGVVKTIAVRAGDSVKQGQVLAEIEPAEADAGLAQAKAARDKAVRDFERGGRLYKDSVITREQLEDLGTAATIAKAQFDAAHFNRGYAQIVAPADGVVLRRLGEERELIAAGQPLLILSRSGAGYVLRLGLPDRDVVRLKRGDPARIDFDAYPERHFSARIADIGGAADPRSGTFPIELEVDPQELTLPSGLIGRATISGGSTDATRSYVPLAALVEGDSRAALLFVFDGKLAHQRRVSVAFVSGDRAALSEALPAGTRVVTDGAAYLNDGDAVRIVP